MRVSRPTPTLVANCRRDGGTAARLTAGGQDGDDCDGDVLNELARGTLTVVLHAREVHPRPSTPAQGRGTTGCGHSPDRKNTSR